MGTRTERMIASGRRAIALGFAAGCLLQAKFARADAAEGNNIYISAERICGVSVTHRTFGPNDSVTTETRETYTAYGLLWNSGSFFHNTPRFAIDATVYSGLSLGGSVGIFGFKGTVDQGDPANDGDAYSFWIVAPRVGYVIPLGGSIAFWPRAGVSVFGGSSGTRVGDRIASDRFSGVSVDLEPTLTYAPIGHAGLTLSAVVDLPVSGKLTRDPAFAGGKTTDWKQRLTNYGLVVGAFLRL